MAFVGPVAAAALTFGLVETSAAALCASDSTNTLDTLDVTLNDGGGVMGATDCGFGSQNNDTVSPPTSSWQVNVDDAGSLAGDWLAYMKQNIEESDSSTDPDYGPGAGVINLQLTSFTGPVDDPFSSGTFTVNAFDPILIVLKEGNAPGSGGNYAWYYFEGKTGPATGEWDTTNPFDGRNLSHMSAYVVPVPAAVWLFGSGLLGLVGIARRKKEA